MISHTQIPASCTHLISPYYSNDLAEQLYWASWDGRDQEVLELLQRGAPPNNSDYYTRVCHGNTPLHRACQYNHHRSAELLIKYGAIVAATDYDNQTPLHWACTNNYKAIAQLLLEHNCPTGEPGSVSPPVSIGAPHQAMVTMVRQNSDRGDRVHNGDLGPLHGIVQQAI